MKVAFVGMTLEGTPLIVSPDGISSVNFLDEAESVNALVPHLQRRGVEAIVVLLHEGGSVAASGNGAGSVSTINSCTNPTGAIPEIVPMMDDAIDIVITGHTNWAVNCLIDGKVVTGAASQGRLITDIDASIDRKSGDFVPGSITVNNRIVTRDVAPAPALTDLIAEYNVVRRADRERRRWRDHGTVGPNDGSRRRLVSRTPDCRCTAGIGAGCRHRLAVRAHESGWHPRQPGCG